MVLGIYIQRQLARSQKPVIAGKTTGTTIAHKAGKEKEVITKVGTAAVCRKIKKETKCTMCGKVMSSSSKNDTKHSMNATVTKEAICTSEGIITYKCKDCGYSYESEVDKKEHNYSDATCTSPAKCTICGATSGKATGHNYSVKTVVEPTYTTEGKRQYTCKKCGYSYNETISKKENSNPPSDSTCTHNYVGKVTLEATCKSAGTAVYTCSKCKDTYTRTLSKKDHNYTSATCISPAKCIMCGITSGKPAGHDYKVEKIKEGLWRYTCKNCGYSYTDKTSQPASPKVDTCTHTNVSEPTCTAAGKCESCGVDVKPALGHSYGEYIQNSDYHVRYCSTCGATDKQKHNFVKVGILKEATCIATGEIQYECDICGYLKTENISKVAHVYDSEAGYSSDAKYHYTHCKWCEAVNPKKVSHTWSDGVCKVCNYVCKHSYESKKIGKKVIEKCTLCNMYKETNICEHDYSCVSDVYGHYYKCTKCGNVNKSKSGTHKYESKAVDLCNGFHQKKCTAKECDYVLKSPHIYINGKCISCGSQNTTGIQAKVDATGLSIDLSSKSDDSKALQEKLLLLGYNIGGTNADGVIGSNTIKGLNEFLADQGSSREIKSKDEITPEVFQLLMICKETKAEARTRINKKQAEDLIKDLENKINNEQATKEEKIKYAQAILQNLGYYPATEGINGSANSATKDALKIYCISNGIDVSSVDVNSMDFDFLKEMGNVKKTYAEVKQEKLAQIKSGKIDFDISSKNQRMEIQLMLKASGYYTGSINGELDSNTKKALKQLCEDKGLGLPNITDWSQITLKEFTVIATTDKKGLEEFKRSDGNDKTFIGAVKDVKKYYADHGFKYCKECGAAKMIVSNSTRVCSHKGGAYTTDCSAAITTYLYYYAKANGSDTMMREFDQQKNSDEYVRVFNNDGYINGVKYFEKVPIDEIQEGDILVRSGHVEIYAGSMADSTHANVYNAGDDTYIANPGTAPSSNKHPLSGYKILRTISPDEVAELDDQN